MSYPNRRPARHRNRRLQAPALAPLSPAASIVSVGAALAGDATVVVSFDLPMDVETAALPTNWTIESETPVAMSWLNSRQLSMTFTGPIALNDVYDFPATAVIRTAARGFVQASIGTAVFLTLTLKPASTYTTSGSGAGVDLGAAWSPPPAGVPVLFSVPITAIDDGDGNEQYRWTLEQSTVDASYEQATYPASSTIVETILLRAVLFDRWIRTSWILGGTTPTVTTGPITVAPVPPCG